MVEEGEAAPTVAVGSPVALGELVVGLVLGVAVEVEDGLDEVLAEHLRVVLQQQVQQAVLTQAAKQDTRV